MARKSDTDDKLTTNSQGRHQNPGVKDLPPANPLGEPVEPLEAYSDAADAENPPMARKPNETVVEHPLSPTDANPNPHGQREEANFTETVRDPDTKVERRQPATGLDVEIEGLTDNPVHLGDGRTLAKGGTAKVSNEVAQQLVDAKQAKRV
jgi:hypothetical protein